VAYFSKVAEASDRVRLEELGKTTEGNPFILATVSSPENLRRREELREARAQGARGGLRPYGREG
jgi:hypothetical protein